MNTPAATIRRSEVNRTSHNHLMSALTSLVVMILFMAGVLLPQTVQAAATQAQIDTAITNGLTFMIGKQAADGSFTGTGDSFLPANTGYALTALEHHAEQLKKKPLDAAYTYHANVQNGLNYLFGSATYDATNGYVYWNGGGDNVYQAGAALMAISRSGAPTAVVASGTLKDFTYKQVAQMVVNWLIAGQAKTGGTGGWGYSWSSSNTGGDQSSTGWITMGIGYAIHSMGCTVPQAFYDRLKTFNTLIQSTTAGATFGGAAYWTSNLCWHNTYKTGHLLFQQGLVGDTTSSQNVKDALKFMDTHWADTTNGIGSSGDYGWRGNPGSSVPPSYSGMFAASKGFTEHAIETFTGTNGTHNWYNDFTDVIIANQKGDGSWLGGGYGESNHSAYTRSTAFALLVLLRAQSHTPPTVTSSAATNITTTTATIAGSLTDMGTSTSVDVIFQYGTSPGVYTKETTAQTFTSAPNNFTVNLTGLSINTTFYYRSKAVGSAGVVATGTGYSTEVSFTTPNTYSMIPVIANGTIVTTGTCTGITSGASLTGCSFEFTPSGGYQINGVTADFPAQCGGNVTTNGSKQTFTFTGTAATSCNITAATSKVPFNVTATAGAGGSLAGATPTPQSKTAGQTATFTFNADAGYHVMSVSGCSISAYNAPSPYVGVGLSTYTATTPVLAGACEVAATFESNTAPWTVTATAGAGGTLSGSTVSPQNKFTGATAAFTFNTDANYHIVDVTTNGCGAAYTAPVYTGANAVTTYTYTTSALSASCAVSATFAGNTFPVTTTVVGGTGGTISCDTPALYNSTPLCTITPTVGYHVYDLIDGGANRFSNHSILGDNSTMATVNLNAITSARAVSVKFRKNTYLVSASTSGSGTFTVVDTINAANYADHGTTATFYAKESDGSQLNSITPTGCTLSPAVTPKQNIYTATVTATCSAIASFGADTTPPIITLFTIPATTQTLVIPINFTATDNVAVKEYCVTSISAPVGTEVCSNLPASLAACVWTPDNAAPFIFPVATPEGNYKLCARAKDYAGNISDPTTEPISIDMFNRVNIPRTGQVLCYSATGGVIACATTGAGQDGNTLAGLPWPAPRFASSTVNTVAMVTDKLTGLMFPNDFNKPGAKVSWQAALDYVNALNTASFAGYTDWRLPNRNELATFINRAKSSTAGWLGTEGFINTNPDYYWTSTTDMDTKSSAWTVNFLEGSITTLAKSELHYLVPVRAWQGLGVTQPVQTNQSACYNTIGNVVACVTTGVHTGQDGDIKAGVPWPPANRFGNPDGSAASGSFAGSVGVDRMNSLMWLKDAGTPVVGACSAGAKTWQAAIDYVKCLNTAVYLGYSDWRLPNTVEMQTLFNGGVADGQAWLQTTVGFSNVQSTGYWSASTDVNLAARAWMYDVKLGKLTHQAKTTGSYHVWPVRGGLIGNGLIEITPAEPDFGQVAYGGTDIKTINIKNTGTTALEITSMFIDTGDKALFTLNVSPAVSPCGSYAPTLAAGASCNVAVTFAPIDAANRSTVFTVTSSDSANPSREIILTGSGVSTINSVSGGNGTIACLPASVASGSATVCTMVPAVGYHLTSISKSDGGAPVDVFGARSGDDYVQSSYTLENIVKTHTITAGFSINTYAVSAAPLLADAGTAHGYITCTPGGSVGHGTAATCTVYPNSGYHLFVLTDNTIDVTGGVAANDYPIGSVTAAHTIVATFAINTYAINASKTGNGTIACSPNPVNHNVTSICTITPAVGYELTALTDNSVAKNISSGGLNLVNGGTYSIATVTAKHDVAATFTIKHYTVTIADSDAHISTVPAASVVVDHGNYTSIALTLGVGYEVDPAVFDNKTCLGTLRGNQFDVGPVTADCTVPVGAKIRTFTVAASQTGFGGTIDQSSLALSRTINYNAITAYILQPGTGYQSTASGCGGSLAGDTFTTSAITSNCNIDVVFKDIQIPVVTVFALPSANSSLSVPIALLTFTDNSDPTGRPGDGVTGWYLTSVEKGAAAPTLPNPATWLDKKPEKFSLPANAGAGIHTLYVWVRDAAGNVSVSKNADVKIVFPSQTRLIRTGQDTCYDAAGATVTCSTATDTHDGKIKAGVPWVPVSRFVDNGDGSFTDSATGLMWTQTANVKYARTNYEDPNLGLVTWQGALDYIKILNGENYQGFIDWRLPNRCELTSIMSYGATNLATWLGSFSPAFTDIPATPGYWSSTTDPAAAFRAFQLYNDGSVAPATKTGTAYMLVVRTPLKDDAVGYIKPRTSLLVTGQSSCFNVDGTSRLCADADTAVHTGEDGDMMSGVPYVEPRFVNPDGTALVGGSTVVLDQATGLNWMLNAATPTCTPPSSGVPITAGAQTWAKALEYVSCLNDTFFAGRGDWRLPNVLEYSTLVNSAQSDNVAWLTGLGFSGIQSTPYWTSDTLIATKTKAYGVNVGSYSIAAYDKTAAKYVWPVRGGYIYQPGIPFSISTNAINFGTVAGSTNSEPVLFTVTNDSGAAFTINSVTKSGDAATPLFTLHTDGGGATACSQLMLTQGSTAFTLADNESCTMAVTFFAEPPKDVAHSATLAITGSTGYTANMSLTATSGPSTFKVTILPSAGGLITCQNDSVVEGSGLPILCRSVPDDGMAFKEIVDNGSVSVNSNIMYMITPVTSNHTLQAVFEERIYTITTQNSGNGSVTITPVVDANNPVKYKTTGHQFTLVAATGSHFTSVTGCSGNLSAPVNGTYTYTTGSIVDDCTITAKFDLDTFPVNVKTTGEGALSCVPLSPVDYGSAVVCTAVPGTGYSLTGLTDDTNASAFTSMSGGLVYTIASLHEARALTATFTINKYTVTGTAGSGGTISPSGAQANKEYGSTVQFDLTADSGYHVTSVSGCGGNGYVNSANAVSTYNYTTGVLAADCAVTATFGKNSYNVIPAVTGNGTLTPDTTQSVLFSSTTSFIATADTGSHIVSIKGCLASDYTPANETTALYTAVTKAITGDCTMNVEFALNKYTVTPSVLNSKGGTVSPAVAQTITYGSKPAFILTPDAGYRVKEVTGTCGGFVSGNSFTTKAVSADCTVIVEFGAIPYTITTTIPGTATIDTAGPLTVEYGSVNTFAVGATAGNSIAAITGCTGVANGGSYVTSAVTADCNITVTTVPIVYTVTVSPGNNGTMSGVSNTGYYNDKLVFTAVPNPGYELDTYVNTCGATMKTAPNTIETAGLTANCLINATFKAKKYKVTTNNGSGAVTFAPTVYDPAAQPATGIDYSATATFTINPVAGRTITAVTPGAGCVTESWVAPTYKVKVYADCVITTTTLVDQFTITATPSSNGAISPVTGLVNYGDSPQYAVTPDANYHIVSVTVDSVLQTVVDPKTFSHTFSNVIANGHSIAAVFTIDTYTVTATQSANGSIKVNGSITATGTYNYNTSHDYVVTANANYHITSVTIDGVTTTYTGNATKSYTKTFANISANHTITAAFAIDGFAVGSTVSGTGSGTISCVPSSVSYGGSSVCTITPAASNKLTALTDNAVSVYNAGTMINGGSYTISSIAADHAVAGTFIDMYTITATQTANGSITATGTYDRSTDKDYVVTANANFHITSVTIDGVTTTYNGNATKNYTKSFTNISAIHTVTATFAIDTFAVSSSVTGDGTVTCVPATVNYNSSSACTIAPTVGNKLTEITDNASSVYNLATMKNGGSYTIINVTADHAVVGTFVAYQWKVTASATGNGGSLTPVSVVYGDTNEQPAFKLVQYSGYQINPRVDTCGSITTTVATNLSDLVVQPLTKNCALTFTFVPFDGFLEIVTTAGAGGSITPTSAVFPTASKTITVTPNSGYHIISVTVDGVIQTLADLKTFSVSFNTIVAGHAVNALFAADESDFNGDGRTDVVWRNTATGENIVWYMNGKDQIGTGVLATLPNNASNIWEARGIANFNNDANGKADMLWRNSITGQNLLWNMDGVTRTSMALIPLLQNDASNNWTVVGSADFNNDGKPDVLWRNSVTGQNSIWYMDGATRTSIASIATLPNNATNNWVVVGCGDFNRDGKPDILWRNTITGQNLLWYMDGTVRTSMALIPSLPNNATNIWVAASVADFNNDGKPDIIWRNTITSQTLLWFMDNTVRTSMALLPALVGDMWKIVGK